MKGSISIIKIIFILVILFDIILFIYILSQLKVSIPGSKINIDSLDKSVQFKLENKEILFEYANRFEVFQDSSVAISESSTTVNWISVKNLTFLYSPDKQRLIDIESQGQPVLSYDIKTEDDKNLTIVFNYLLLKDKSIPNENLEKEMSGILIRLLYRITHYLPKKQYSYDELSQILLEIEKQDKIITVKRNL